MERLRIWWGKRQDRNPRSCGRYIHCFYENKIPHKQLFVDYLQGKVKIDEYVTHHRKFSEINDGFHDMHVS
jgi:Zn-dependent alcohol dehydrogenase